jgi:hypothetical protein
MGSKKKLPKSSGNLGIWAVTLSLPAFIEKVLPGRRDARAVQHGRPID